MLTQEEVLAAIRAGALDSAIKEGYDALGARQNAVISNHKATLAAGMRIRFTDASRYRGQTGVVDKVLQKNVDIVLDEKGAFGQDQRVRATPTLVEVVA